MFVELFIHSSWPEGKLAVQHKSMRDEVLHPRLNYLVGWGPGPIIQGFGVHYGAQLGLIAGTTKKPGLSLESWVSPEFMWK